MYKITTGFSKKYLIIFLLPLLLWGCASNQSSVSKSAQIMKSPNDSTLVVCRTSGGNLLLRRLDVIVNSSLITDIGNASAIEITTAPGNKEVRFKFPWDVPTKDIGLNIALQPGETKYVVIGTNLDSFFILPMAGFIKSSWRVTEAKELPAECSGYSKRMYRN